MARLKLKPGVTYRDVGDVIARLASASRSGLREEEQALLREFRCLIDETDEAIADLSVSTLEDRRIPNVDANSVYLNLHFDKTIGDTGQRLRIVNVVVPDFDGKLLDVARTGGFPPEILENGENADYNDSLFDLSAVAKEAFGFIVICGCAG